MAPKVINAQEFGELARTEPEFVVENAALSVLRKSKAQHEAGINTLRVGFNIGPGEAMFGDLVAPELVPGKELSAVELETMFPHDTIIVAKIEVMPEVSATRKDPATGKRVPLFTELGEPVTNRRIRILELVDVSYPETKAIKVPAAVNKRLQMLAAQRVADGTKPQVGNAP